MSFNVVDVVKNLFTDEVVSNASSALGESQTSVSKAISGIVPSIIGGIASKVSSGDNAANNILHLAETYFESGSLNNLKNFFASGTDSTSALSKGWELLKTIFGDKLNSVTSAVANYAGIQESSSASLMSMVAPAALSVIGQHSKQNGWSATNLLHMFIAEKNKIVDAIPGGLGSSLTGLLGLSSIGKTASPSAHVEPAHEEESGSGKKFLVPLFLGILAVAVLIYLFKGCNDSSKPTASATDSTAAPAINVDSTLHAALVPIKVKLPNGVELDAYKGGIEDQLVAFLMTDYSKLGADSLKNIWFDFDNLNFKLNSAEITPESQHQIDNITAILKAFPKTKIKIGGYTDKTGDEAINKKLSKDRADAVSAALGKSGVGSQVVGADGYGSDFAKYAATDPEIDRKKDRHVSVSVRL